jgi:hypothetical protein
LSSPEAASTPKPNDCLEDHVACGHPSEFEGILLDPGSAPNPHHFQEEIASSEPRALLIPREAIRNNSLPSVAVTLSKAGLPH